MNGVLALVAATVVSIDVGWQPLADGGFEYIIQIEPHMLGTLEGGQAISSELPRNLRGMRSYRIIVGNAKLPHEGEPPPVEPAPAGQSPPPPAADVIAPKPPASSVGDRPPAASAAAAPSDVGTAPPRPATADTTRALPGPGPDFASPPAEARPTSAETADAGNADVAAEATPPPTLEPEPNAKDIAPRMAGYLESPAASHAGKGDTGSRVSGSLKFPGTGASNSGQPPVDATAAAAGSPASQSDVKTGAGATSAPPGANSSGTGSDDNGASEAKPWLPLAGAVIALFASLGANVYLAWNTLALRSRYRSLVAQFHAG